MLGISSDTDEHIYGGRKKYQDMEYFCRLLHHHVCEASQKSVPEPERQGVAGKNQECKERIHEQLAEHVHVSNKVTGLFAVA